MKSRSRDGLAVKGLLIFKHKNCFQNNTVEKKKNEHVICARNNPSSLDSSSSLS